MNSQTPVPHGIPLPLPAPEWVLVAVLVGFFLMHIFFITMMVGGTFMTLVYQVKGLKESKWEALAHDLATTITVNKSIAVVLGVGPLLAINTLYTVYFYSANALTGDFWIMIIPLVAGAFLLTYAHKYLWGRLPVWLHLGLISIVVAVFAFVPLIFLTNVNLMLYPGRWPEVKGFFDALMLPNVWPRYFHFILSCPAMAGLMVVWMYRRRNQEELASHGLDRAEMVRLGYRWLLWPTAAQFLVGPWAMLTLPEVPGPTGMATAIFLASMVVALFLCVTVYAEIRRPDTTTGNGFGSVAISMLAIMIMMGAGRHMYREAAIDDHQALVQQKTETFRALSEDARKRALQNDTGN
ncbi:hypothetical protein [Pannonibacter indicus]|uniref:hypothetical protein n=1 Tax=Pannonibacter indicus TaxID=466044 RepID=UPI00391D530A